MIHPWHALRYAVFIGGEVLAGSARVVRAAWGPDTIRPAVIEYPLRCHTDIEVTTMASSITITPGTLVVGIAHATAEAPVTLFVHSMFDPDRGSVVAGLRDMEDRLLRMTRGRAGAT